MNYYDSHTHLNNSQLYPEWKQHMQSFTNNGGVGLVNIGVDDGYNTRGIQIAQLSKIEFPQLQIGCTVGIHPCYIVESNKDKDKIDQDIVQLELLLQNHKDHIRGIGECGTDLHWPCTPQQHEMQQYATHCQAKLCQKYNLPLIIHSRSDRDGSYAVLKDYSDIVINLHCRNYTPTEIQIALDTWGDQVYFGFGGIITYPKAGDVRDSLALCPIGQIILETDAPYLPPQAHRGSSNYPHYIADVYKKASEVLAIDEDVLCQQVEKNWKRLYQIDSDNIIFQ